MSQQTTSVSQWNRRYISAYEKLLSINYMVQLQRRIAGTASSSSPVTVVHDDGRLRVSDRIGVFTGSFNPLTVAHTDVMDLALRLGYVDVFVWGFTRTTVDKENVTRASLVDRVAQLDSLVSQEGNAGGLVLIEQGLYADQAAYLSSVFGRRTALWLIVGFDKIVQIFDPRYYKDLQASLQRLFANAGIIVVSRDGNGEQELLTLLSQSQNRAYADRVRFLQSPTSLQRVSSTSARSALERYHGSLVRDAIPELAPEGAALADATEAYASPRQLINGETVDTYGVRNAWLDCLATTPLQDVGGASLANLVALGSASSKVGTGIRRWLQGDRWIGGPSTVTELIEYALQEAP